jgi:hypothetical protein
MSRAARALAVVAWAACSPGGSEAGPDASSANCGDTSSDPDNCGQCGRTCVVPNAQASCAQGECELGSCNQGFVDQDRDPSNGCELQSDCAAGADCATECGSTGVVVCDAGESACTPPSDEACNAVDDDCNGECDEGAMTGCRVGIHRSFGSGHLYTTDLNAAGAPPFNLEVENYFRLYQSFVPGSQPVFLCRKADGTHLVTSDTGCEGVGTMLLTLGYWAQTPSCGATPLHRLYHQPSNNHFYTLSESERDNAVTTFGYVSNGIVGYVWEAP